MFNNVKRRLLRVVNSESDLSSQGNALAQRTESDVDVAEVRMRPSRFRDPSTVNTPRSQRCGHNCCKYGVKLVLWHSRPVEPKIPVRTTSQFGMVAVPVTASISVPGKSRKVFRWA